MVLDFFILNILFTLNTPYFCFLFGSIQGSAWFWIHLRFLLDIRLYELIMIFNILRSQILFRRSWRLGFFKSISCRYTFFTFRLTYFLLRILIAWFWDLSLIIGFLRIAAIIVFALKHKIRWLRTVIYFIIFIVVIVFIMA